MFPPSTAPSAPAPSTPESARPRPRLPSFSDGIGDRVLVFDQKTNAWMELLRFKREFSHARGFFNALKDRIQELQTLNHDGLSKARSIEWLAGGEGLALVSNHTPGKRLSELTTEARGPQFAQELIGQISPALAALHVHSFNSFHGAITADRIVVTPEGRLVLIEFRKETAWVPIREEHKMTIREARLELEDEGYRFDRVIDVLPWQHILVFRPAGDRR